MGMEGALSARPEGSIVPADGQAVRHSGLRTHRRVSLYKRRDAILGASAAVLAYLALVSHFIEAVPLALAPICAACSALIIGIIWRSERTDDREFAAERCFPTATASGDDKTLIAWPGPARAQAHPRLAAELAQAEALAQLTAKISHELRTPLNAVIGFSELMSRETFGPLGSQRYQTYAEHILACGQTLLKSAEDTLAITSALAEPMKVGGSAAQPLVLSKLLSEARCSLGSQLPGRELPIECILPGEIALCGDARALRQVFINLMQEAGRRSCGKLPVLVQARLEGQTVKLEFSGYHGYGGDSLPDSLPLSVARALSELHGMHLKTKADEGGWWRAEVVLEQALQQDFFGAASSKSQEVPCVAA